MTAFILPKDGSGRVVTFDAIEAEVHETVAVVTDHPVEVGTTPTDHVKVSPVALSLVAFTSNQPVAINPFTGRGRYGPLRLYTPRRAPALQPTPGSLYAAGLQRLKATDVEPVSANVLIFDTPFDAIRETYDTLLELQQGVLLDIVTGIHEYQDMVLVRVSAPRNAGEGGVSFGLDLRHIRIVNSGTVDTSPVPADNVPGGKPLVNKGGQGTKKPKDEKRPGSIAFQILKSQGVI